MKISSRAKEVWNLHQDLHLASSEELRESGLLWRVHLLPSKHQEANCNDFVTDCGAILTHLNSHSCNKRKGQQMATWSTAQWGNPAILGKPATWGCLLERCEAQAAEAVETLLKGMRLPLAPEVSRPLQEGRGRKLRRSLADKVETDWICVRVIRIHIICFWVEQESC